MQNTANPIWRAKFEFPYERKLKILVFLYDVDGQDGEPIGSCVLNPKKAQGTINIECGDAIRPLGATATATGAAIHTMGFSAQAIPSGGTCLAPSGVTH